MMLLNNQNQREKDLINDFELKTIKSNQINNMKFIVVNNINLEI